VCLLAATSGADNQLHTSLFFSLSIPLLRPHNGAEETCADLSTSVLVSMLIEKDF
jgi:hypothetical protein